jgi:hypothetical protein
MFRETDKGGTLEALRKGADEAAAALWVVEWTGTIMRALM